MRMGGIELNPSGQGPAAASYKHDNEPMNLKVACTAMITLLAARRSASQELVLYWYLLHLILFYDTREICNIGKWIHKYVQDIPCY